MAVTMRNKTYDRLKHVTQVVLPAAGTFYTGLAVIWGLPHGEEVAGSILLTTTFLGITLNISSRNYNPDLPESDDDFAGDFVMNTDPDGKKIIRLQLDRDPRDMIDHEKIVFKVVDVDKEEQNERFWDGTAE